MKYENNDQKQTKLSNDFEFAISNYTMEFALLNDTLELYGRTVDRKTKSIIEMSTGRVLTEPLESLGDLDNHVSYIEDFGVLPEEQEELSPEDLADWKRKLPNCEDLVEEYVKLKYLFNKYGYELSNDRLLMNIENRQVASNVIKSVKDLIYLGEYLADTHKLPEVTE